MPVYRFTDRDGDKLAISSAPNNPNTVHIARTCGVLMPADELPKFVAKLYEAAGQPAPIILDRPSPEALREWISGGEVDAYTDLRWHSPQAARERAAHLAAAADLIEAEKTNKAVSDLAVLLVGAAQLPKYAAETLARAVLSAGYAKAAE
ncbi:hypothetical protein AB0I81_39915 [Nonomuraea sp. NPDC050404]|uniref:hypothetical protein n=1 Tax=Nonomuraea sp. NPDC050404 TaxID=3155783 RepID=UPI00340BB69F